MVDFALMNQRGMVVKAYDYVETSLSGCEKRPPYAIVVCSVVGWHWVLMSE